MIHHSLFYPKTHQFLMLLYLSNVWLVPAMVSSEFSHNITWWAVRFKGELHVTIWQYKERDGDVDFWPKITYFEKVKKHPKMEKFWKKWFLTILGMKFKKSSETLKNKNDATCE